MKYHNLYTLFDFICHYKMLHCIFNMMKNKNIYFNDSGQKKTFMVYGHILFENNTKKKKIYLTKFVRYIKLFYV